MSALTEETARVLIAELKRHTEVLQRRAQHPRPVDHIALVRAIAGVIGGRVFSTRELWIHGSVVNEQLRAVLHEQELPTPRHLGIRLKHLAGQDLGGLVVVRGKADGCGVQWAIEPLGVWK